MSCKRPTSRILRAFYSQEWYDFTERRNTKREKFNCVKIVGSRQDRTCNMYETLPSERGLGIIFTAAENCSNDKKLFYQKIWSTRASDEGGTAD